MTERLSCFDPVASCAILRVSPDFARKTYEWRTVPRVTSGRLSGVKGCDCQIDDLGKVRGKGFRKEKAKKKKATWKGNGDCSFPRI